MSYTNNTNLPLSIAVWLASDSYDYNNDPLIISATNLLKPIRELLLTQQVSSKESIDISQLIPSKIGTAIHDSLEQAWKYPHNALKVLGYPKRLIDNLIVNPKPDELKEDSIPTYIEQRSHKKLGDWTISGKFDFVAEGKLQDFKSTSVMTWINKSNDKKYIQQGSIYRWLNPDIITEDYMSIQYIFTDWSAIKAKTDKNYPPKRVMEQTFKLMSMQETENFIRSVLSNIERYKGKSQAELPICTKEELWERESVWKYYKNPKNKNRSTKNFSSEAEAYTRMSQDGNIGEVVKVPGEVVYCRYCSCNSVCTQAQGYLAEGRLKL